MSGLIREYEVNGDNYDEEKETYSLWKEKDAGCFVHYIAGHRAGLRFCRCYLQKDPSYLDLMNYTKAPNAEFWFGTDTLGRDIFSCIWHGGRVSLLIGVASTALSTVIAIVYGAISGIAGEKWIRC